MPPAAKNLFEKRFLDFQKLLLNYIMINIIYKKFFIYILLGNQVY
jgi:hypothetical protein